MEKLLAAPVNLAWVPILMRPHWLQLTLVELVDLLKK
jgi:hypothetical protein